MVYFLQQGAELPINVEECGNLDIYKQINALLDNTLNLNSIQCGMQPLNAVDQAKQQQHQQQRKYTLIHLDTSVPNLTVQITWYSNNESLAIFLPGYQNLVSRMTLHVHHI